MPVIPATWETEIRGQRFEASWDKKLVITFLKNKPAMVIHICNPCSAGGRVRSGAG
jgi:hypothetical protein